MAETFDILTRVKNNLGITGNYQDNTLMGYIEEVKAYLKDAGVADEIIESEVSAGVISRGVSDLWNYGAGNAELSPYFFQRATQLSYKEGS